MEKTLSNDAAAYHVRVGNSDGKLWDIVVIVAMSLLVTVLYAPMLESMVLDWWNDPNYSHGFLVPVFSGYLVWQRREKILSLRQEGSWIGFLVVAGGLGMLVLGDLAAEHFISRSSLIVVLAGLTLFHAGFEVLRVIAFPLAFLFFMIPLPSIIFNAIVFPLQGLAAENGTWALDRLGVPVLRDGNVIHLSQITLGVTEACSGIRSLISLLAVAVAWGYFTIRGFGWQVLFIVSAVPITIVANAGRVVATGLIGQWFGIEYAQGFFHTFSGWIVFVFAFIALLGMHGLISVLCGVLRRMSRA